MITVACPYCLALEDEPCRSHQQGCSYPPPSPVLVKRPHVERVLAAQRRAKP